MFQHVAIVLESTMKKTALTALLGALLLSATAAHADTLTEDFSGVFPAWESGWFGTHSTASNYYCGGSRGCTQSSGPYLWVVGETGGSASPVEVKFDATFGASLNSLAMDLGSYQPATLAAYDRADQLIFSQAVTLDGANYHRYTITSSTGISRFTLSGQASGNTQLDNLTAITGAVPEPGTWAMLVLGLGVLGVAARRRA
jgi:hypothetical protein